MMTTTTLIPYQGRETRSVAYAQHQAAIRNPQGFARAMLDMLSALATYADAHHARYGEPIAQDGYIGVAWLEQAKAWRDMLNGELAGLDGGSCDSAILDLIERAGFSQDEL